MICVDRTFSRRYLAQTARGFSSEASIESHVVLHEGSKSGCGLLRRALHATRSISRIIKVIGVMLGLGRGLTVHVFAIKRIGA